MNNFQKQLQTRRIKSKKPRILWLTTDWASSPYREANDLYGGIGYYRVMLPSRQLRDFYDITVVGSEFKHWGTEDETYTRLGRDYDLIICKHMTDGKTGSNILAAAKHFGRKVLVDIDDNYLDMRKDNPAISHYDVGKGGRYFIGAFLELADGVIVTTEPLKKAYSKLNKNIFVLPNCNDIYEWPKPVKKDDGQIRIGYAGGSAHNDDLDLIIEPVAKILEKYPNVRFETIGAISVDKARDMAAKMLKFGNHKILDRFGIMGGTPAWQGYPELLAAQGWDIGICPLVNEKFNQGKSHIKFLEYSMMNMATVASPVHPYIVPIDDIPIIEHGKTGLFANSPDEWFECLEMLIRNPDVRIKMGKNAYEFVKENWQAKNWALSWKQVIDKFL